ncbi:type II toxin-antitoxin system RelE/ParE family toxin [Tsuneonella flava]|uniref:Type II toxin-antitoxin system RelE/ParE family toxin n=1 Tax=Tsuneonella flava TaxID=2055955 RepID=A0ABX7KAZ3_9SPHN|nr:type II toxin-antitoxin system RelE/ParE family toxin [Tsuneonella flava]QSB43675.1 type II toxin-antitoxin system RelE/ParE family toxin [Tsuneonella flava]
MTGYTFRQDARDDMREIALYIGQEDPDRAEKFIGDLITRISQVAENPRLYRSRFEWNPGVRITRHGRYYIVFHSNGDAVEILRVIHTSRDIGTILEELE